MSLAQGFIDLAERTYSIDWAAIQRSVTDRLKLGPSFDAAVYDPRRHPTYWCLPVLVGNYVGASRSAVLDDLAEFVSGCVMRHFIFESEVPFDPSGDEDRFRVIAGAYASCHLDRTTGIPFEARFAAKCLPWTVLLAMGTQAILAETGRGAEYESAMSAIVLVYSGLQLIDDWHDQEEDRARSLWNIWVHEPPARGLAVIEPLLRGCRNAVHRLRPHLLRSALDAQLTDVASDLRDVVGARERV